GLEMEDAAAMVFIGAEDRPPVGAIGMNAPDASLAAVAQALRFERAEEDAAVLKDHRVQGAADVEMADLLDIPAVVVHDEELHGRTTSLPGRCQAVAVADERDPASRQRARVHVVNARPGPGLSLLRHAGVGRPLLLRQTNGPASFDVDLVDVGAAAF